MSWEPLHGGDPFPADHETMLTYGEDVSRTGELIGEQVRLLRLVARQDRWETQAADAFRERATETADKIEETEGRYVRVGAAIVTLACALAEHESRARDLVDEAREAEQTIRNNPEVSPSPEDDGSPGELTGAERAQNTRRSNATSRLSTLQTSFNRVVEQAEEDARTCQRAIDDAKNDDVKDNWWERNAGWLKAIATGLGAIAAIAGLVFITIATAGTIWLVVAVVAGVAALAINLGLALKADGSWTDVALDAVGLVTLGTGGVLIRVARTGFAGVRTAAASARASSVVTRMTDGSRVFRLVSRVGSYRVPLVSRAARAGHRALDRRAVAHAVSAGRAVLETPATTGLARLVAGGREQAELLARVTPTLRELTRTGTAADVVADLSRINLVLRTGQVTSAAGVAAGGVSTARGVYDYGRDLVDAIRFP